MANLKTGDLMSASYLSPQPIVCLSRDAMACLFEIQFPQGSLDRRDALRAFDWIDDVERQLSVYRDDSDISRVNRDAFGTPVELDALLLSFLIDCKRLWAETGGAFDITSGPLIRTWGFKRREGRMPSPEEIESARELVGMNHVQFDVNNRTVRLAKQGMEINLGGIGKGYALDRMGDWLVAKGARSALLGAGQSSIRAVGDAPGEQGWLVTLANPSHERESLATLRLQNKAISTSGTTEQFFEHEGRRLGHILDPRTGWPVEGMKQVTALAPTAAWAEALSTAFFVLGVNWTVDYCRRNPGIGTVLVPSPPPDRPLVAHITGEVDVVRTSRECPIKRV